MRKYNQKYVKPPSDQCAYSQAAIAVRVARCAEALKLRESGLTYQDIGGHFGVSRQRVLQMVQQGIMDRTDGLA